MRVLDATSMHCRPVVCRCVGLWVTFYKNVLAPHVVTD